MKILRDTWLVFGRYLGLLPRNPLWVVIGVVQPLLYLHSTCSCTRRC